MATTDNVKKDDLSMLADPIQDFPTSRSHSPLNSGGAESALSQSSIDSHRNAIKAMYSANTAALSTKDGMPAVTTEYPATKQQQSWMNPPATASTVPRNANVSLHMDEKKDDGNDRNMNELKTLATVSPPNESSVSPQGQLAATMKPFCLPETAIIKRPSPFDVVLEDNMGSASGQTNDTQNCNNGSSANEWHNSMFAQLLAQHAESFSLAPLSNQALIVQAISSKIQQANGRFLERYGKGWKEITGQPVMLGIAQALFHHNAQNNNSGEVKNDSESKAAAAASVNPQPTSTAQMDGLNQSSLLQLYSEPVRSADTMSRKARVNPMESSPTSRRAIRVALPMAVETSSSSLEPKTQVAKKTQQTKYASNQKAVYSQVPKTIAAVSQVNGNFQRRSRPSASNNSAKSKLSAAETVVFSDPKSWMATCGTQEYMEQRAMEMLPGLHVEKLPRGVTIRPSGKWQAQFYFDGQSRYIGVFDGSYPAALAYECVHRLLATYRDLTRKAYSKDTLLDKQEVKKLFDCARMAATSAVNHYKPTRDE